MASAATATPPKPAGLSADLRKAAALVVDGNPNTRMTLAGQLRTMGLTSVSQASKIAEARRELERHTFDVVVCGDEFPKEGGTGQELLDDLRRNQLLPFHTVFVMVTAEASYAKVAEAAESALDAYLLKPITASDIEDRLKAMLEKRQALLPINAKLAKDDLAGALATHREVHLYLLEPSRPAAERVADLCQECMAG